MNSIIKESGIYKIENKVTKEFYIGSSISLYYRTHAHVSYLRNNKHQNKHLQNSWNKYGEENFEISILEHCDANVLTIREQYYIDTLSPKFNKTIEVIRNTPSIESVKKHSETKKRMFASGELIPNGEREVYQYDVDGNFIQKFRSIAIACRTVGCHESSIHRCLRGTYEQCVNFQWKSYYCGEKISPSHNKKRKCITLKLYKFIDINTNKEFLLNIFEIESKFQVTRADFYQYINKGLNFKKQYRVFRTNQKVKIDLIKSDELLENPEEDNQQPS